jgi:argininosuccinate lyase/amino-acid N-acetyltransferase
MKLWGGRFAENQDPAFESFNRSLPFDRRLLEEDVRGSRAWARALAKAGVLTRRERRSLDAQLARVASRARRDPDSLSRSDAEDVHSFVEGELVRRTGALGKRLHTGRSRNDQVATDFRLFARRACEELEAAISVLMRALVSFAARHAATPMPGYTHLQRAQPITFGHHALAYVEMLDRDRGRFAAARECPLGAGALAGTAFRIDRDALARDLSFARAMRNSLDAVSDRDFVAETIFVCSLTGVHLSRFAEDWIFFSSTEAGFLELSDGVTTGSSLMPQKKNPDALELIRGKSGRLIGRLAGFLACLKGLPLAYNKDLQEDKEALFEAVDTLSACLAVATLAVKGARVRRRRAADAAASGHLNATDLADYLVERGVPFRDAHERAGRLVRKAIERGQELEELPVSEMKKISKEIGEDVATWLELDSVLGRRAAVGGTSPARVRAEVRRWKKLL